jgi:hypothetical protein
MITIARTTFLLPNRATRLRQILQLPLLLLLGMLLLTGCHPLVRARTLPPSIRNVYVPMIINRTAEPGLEEQLTVAFQEELLADGRLNLVKQKEADATVRITLIQFIPESVRLDEDKFAIRLSWTLQANMEIEENIPGRPLLGGLRKITASHEFNSDPRTTTFNGEPFEKELFASNFARIAAMELITGEFNTTSENSVGTRSTDQQSRSVKTRR